MSSVQEKVYISSTLKTGNNSKEVFTIQPRSNLSSISEEFCISSNSEETINNSTITFQYSNTSEEKVECLTKYKDCCNGCVDCCCITLCSL